jgi:hypothetical protein
LCICRKGISTGNTPHQEGVGGELFLLSSRRRRECPKKQEGCHICPMVSTFTNRSLRKKEQMESENYNIDFSKTALEQTPFGKTVCNS